MPGPSLTASPHNRYFDVAHNKCFDRMAPNPSRGSSGSVSHDYRGDQRQKKEGQEEGARGKQSASGGTLAIWLQDEIAASANSNYQD